MPDKEFDKIFEEIKGSCLSHAEARRWASHLKTLDPESRAKKIQKWKDKRKGICPAEK